MFPPSPFSPSSSSPSSSSRHLQLLGVCALLISACGDSSSSVDDALPDARANDSDGSCQAPPCEPPVEGCGNDQIDEGEQCDGSDLNGQSCHSRLGEGWVGTLGCSSGENACTFDTSGCEQISEDALFVAPDGDDNNSGSINSPWQSWQKAFDSVAPGDTVYFRGGVYMVPANNRGGFTVETSGTAEQNISFVNYPGERPILDFEEVLLGGQFNQNAFYGLKVEADHLNFRGLTIRNLWQQDSNDEVVGAFYIARSSNIHVDNCVVHDIGGNGFKTDNADEIYFTNCDAYHCVDYLSAALPGNDGTGFGDHNQLTTNKSVYYRACRAWENGDQGFSSGSISYSEYDGCWSFNNGALEGAGHGFKMGWVEEPTEGVLNRLYRNNLAVGNRRRGWDSNDQGYRSGAMITYGNFAYGNGCTESEKGECGRASHGFYIFNTLDGEAEELKREYYNNASFGNEDGEVAVENGAFYSHSNNSWDSEISLMDSDYMSLDTSLLMQPRRPDGSLPEIDFAQLPSGSALVDQGKVIEGYHCQTSGPKPGDECKEWFGAAPDIGPFEYRAP